MSTLSMEKLSFSYDKHLILKNISFCAEPGQMICMLGANGVGKSTLFSCILKFHSRYEGRIFIGQKDTRAMSARELAKEIAYVPQSHHPVFNYSVFQVVLMGLSGSIAAFSSPKAEHEDRAMQALNKLSIGHLADCGYMHISGGERQLVLIARALVQNAKILLMDEPTANLDFGNQAKVLSAMKELSKKGYLILFSSHQPDHAYWYADQVLVLLDQQVQAFGKPSEILNEHIMEQIYQIPIHVADVHLMGRTLTTCVPK